MGSKENKGIIKYSQIYGEEKLWVRGWFAAMLQCRDYGRYDYFGLMKLERQ